MRNRVVLITGASSGIGAACARALAESSRLALVARRKDRLDEVVSAITDLGGDALAIDADLTAPGACESVVARCQEEFGGLDALVNNAGVFKTASTASLTRDHVRSQVLLNLEVPIMLTHAALPLLCKNGGGSIVNVSSIAAVSAFAGCGVYAATKAGLDAWSASLREELRADHVRVSVVVPGATDTEVWGEDCPFDRSGMARAEDVARCVRFVLDAPASAAIDRMVVMPPGGAL
ncbi:MAG: SDR family NAD(P)-dependent oxidoreductase [Planctomycetota bacterium]|jgi:NADP-dependent 3-hydroxy acid dehydrogenase YdfG|nr:SDR family NAD(P)-dependent oxidoreductase [Planctomycetota bacterium]